MTPRPAVQRGDKVVPLPNRLEAIEDTQKRLRERVSRIETLLVILAVLNGPQAIAAMRDLGILRALGIL